MPFDWEIKLLLQWSNEALKRRECFLWERAPIRAESPATTTHHFCDFLRSDRFIWRSIGTI
ncbi:MAG: hypothetical protein DWQ35_13825 [Planctomycetota bacterium]|nr:MAG: hypothetical protein DWQ35_13825 [Planctomycetota bacterium]REK25979.1 MAG: hypothetical protein DWQ42_10135 [Planctomycetota bacterium]REK46906.1 MAG: hypothetical protein DWQ46_05270 [Planctomycetota bacterium]